ncbi:ATP-binding protein [Cyanobium sp. FGCU-6]|nr:ATP-binding protein [Cyanobium sp. FGCU6]
MAVVQRFLQPPAQSFFLFGPRGTGKSTWLGHVFPEALRLDLLAPEVVRAYQAQPERLRERIAGGIWPASRPSVPTIPRPTVCCSRWLLKRC